MLTFRESKAYAQQGIKSWMASEGALVLGRVLAPDGLSWHGVALDGASVSGMSREHVALKLLDHISAQWRAAAR